MKCGYFDVSPELLCHLLHLPEGTVITRVFVVNDNAPKQNPDIRIVVNSPGLNDVSDSQPMPRVYPTLRGVGDKTEFVSWGLQP